MPASRFEARHLNPIGEVVVGGGITPGLVERNGARIKRIDVNVDPALFVRGAPLLGEAEFTTHVVQMDSLTEIFGISVEGYYLGPEDSGLRRKIDESVSVQISLDGGNTYLTYDNGWVAGQAGGTFTSLEEFCERCGLLVDLVDILNPKSLSFRVRLNTYTSPANVIYTPVLSVLNCHVEWNSNPYFDLFRTVKELIEEDFRVDVVRRHSMDAPDVAANAVPISTNYTIDAAGTFRVFNLTQDPNKNVNIFSAYDAANSRLNLVANANVVAQDVLEFTFSGSAPVFVVRPDEMAITTNIPSTIVTISAAQDVEKKPSGKITDFKFGTTIRRVRTRNSPVYRSCVVRAEVYARSAREAISSVQNLERVLSQGFQSIATGETFTLKLTLPSVMVDFGDQSYYSGNAEFVVEYFDHSESFEESVVAQSIVAQYGSASRTFSTSTINEVGVVHETV